MSECQGCSAASAFSEKGPRQERAESGKRKQWPDWDQLKTDTNMLNMIAAAADSAGITLEGKYLPKFSINP